MELVFSAVLPVFMIIILGGIAQRLDLLGENSINILNRFVFHFAFPPLLFVIIATAPIHEILNWPYVIALTGGMFATFLAMLLYSLFVMGGTLSMASIRAQAASFSNAGYIGIPMVTVMLGKEALLPMGIAVVLTLLVFIASLVLLKIEMHQAEGWRYVGKQILWMFCTSPVMLAPILGILYATTGLPLPNFIFHFCHQIGNAAAPCALFALGLSLASQKIKPLWSEVLSINFFKLLFQPAITTVLMLAFHVQMLWAVTGVISASISTAVTTFIIAQQHRILDKHIAAVIFYGTVVSIFSMSTIALVLPKIWHGVSFN